MDTFAFGVTGPDVNQRGLSLKGRLRTLGVDERAEKQRRAQRKNGPAVASSQSHRLQKAPAAITLLLLKTAGRQVVVTGILRERERLPAKA
jgi:hypothetical protein